MTYEEMKAIAEKVVAALKAGGLEDVMFFEADCNPGDPLPIGFMRGEDAFTLMLDIA